MPYTACHGQHSATVCSNNATPALHLAHRISANSANWHSLATFFSQQLLEFPLESKAEWRQRNCLDVAIDCDVPGVILAYFQLQDDDKIGSVRTPTNPKISVALCANSISCYVLFLQQVGSETLPPVITQASGLVKPAAILNIVNHGARGEDGRDERERSLATEIACYIEFQLHKEVLSYHNKQRNTILRN